MSIIRKIGTVTGNCVPHRITLCVVKDPNVNQNSAITKQIRNVLAKRPRLVKHNFKLSLNADFVDQVEQYNHDREEETVRK